MTKKYNCNFTPPLPVNSADEVYLDTSVLIPLLLQRKNPLGEAIALAISRPGGKITSSYYVFYEFKRCCLLPLWTLCRLVQQHKRLDIALTHLSQRFSKAGRTQKIIMQFTNELCTRIGLNTQWKNALDRLTDIAEETERAMYDAIKYPEPNKLGCQLHKARFAVASDFDRDIECRAECSIGKFWRGHRKTVSQIAGFEVIGKSREWWKKTKDLLNDVSQDPQKGQHRGNCMALGDVVIALSSKKKQLLLTSDSSFLAISTVTKQQVHLMDSIAKMLGGSADKVASGSIEEDIAAN